MQWGCDSCGLRGSRKLAVCPAFSKAEGMHSDPNLKEGSRGRAEADAAGDYSQEEPQK